MVEAYCPKKSAAFDDIQFYYFLQFHAHRQLSRSTEYARQKGVVLKGDLPIGIARHSCDAWVAPRLYNMNGQAGAPPDFYSQNGQNWGFPTYNWEEMAKDNFGWWRRRMAQLAQYFDALRIDHLLGFFRIWEIPSNQVVGTLGLFNPRLPYSLEELAAFGLKGNLDRYTQPYIRNHFLTPIFGTDTAFVKATFLKEQSPGFFALRPFVDDQLKIKELFENDKRFSQKKHLAENLMKLVAEVLLIEEPGSNGTAFNPRITLTTTRSFNHLSPREQKIFQRLYEDYHYRRHNEFWRQQALWKLPPLLRATNMLICGEDLGMIPATVPKVMRQYNILSLEIQRMPKGEGEFADPRQYPYPSVCSPSCHDMPTIRGWWEEDYRRAQRFYNHFINPDGRAPKECPPNIVETIIRQHLQSPSMLAIFPIQDLTGMDASRRHPVAAAEQINDPANPHHYWRYRFHLPLEKLLHSIFNEKWKNMLEKYGRSGNSYNK
ncbi:MAG TPA: hypothetical protein ENJ20_00810 [Bacteroidetes bacterium]|nr:hypothetical protein [Bacteroidota bacterium]